MPVTDWIPALFRPIEAQTEGSSSEDSAGPCDSESPKMPSDSNSPSEPSRPVESTRPAEQRYTLESEHPSPAASVFEAFASLEKSNKEAVSNHPDLIEYAEHREEQFPRSPFGSVLPSAKGDSKNVGLNPFNHSIIYPGIPLLLTMHTFNTLPLSLGLRPHN